MRDELIRRFDDFGTRIALYDQQVAFTYADLLDRIRWTQTQLSKHGVAPHDTIIVQGDHSLNSIAALFALYINRNVVVPVSALNDKNLEAITEYCNPKYLVKPGAEFDVQALEQPNRRSVDLLSSLRAQNAAGLVLLSSGSTGTPKLILHNLDDLIGEKLQKRPRRRSKSLNILMVLMFDHIGGINSLLSALLVGGTAILPHQRVPDEICRLIQEHRILVLPTSPTFLNLIMVGGYHRMYDLSSLRLITYGTEPMSEELLRRVNECFPGVRLLQTFGTSETGIATTTSESSTSTYFKISDANVEYRIVDGELHLKSRTQFLGYLNYTDASLTEDGWFRTGDLVEESADGYLRIKGRATEVINVGGEKLLPLELESILLSSPLIEDCTVYGRPNAITGQTVCVDIKAKEGLSRAEIRKHVIEFLAGRVEPFKIPSKIAVVGNLEVSGRLKKVRPDPKSNPA